MFIGSRRRVWEATMQNRFRVWGEAGVVVFASAVLVVGSSIHDPFPNQPPPAGSSSFLDQVAGGRKLLGVAPDGIKTSPASLNSFAKLIGREPNIVEFYQGFTEPFDLPVAESTSGTGALPLDSWGPAGTTLADVVSGHDDAYITSFADQVKAYHGQLALTVGHEMNAPWSRWWGNGAQSAPQFVTAWRHIYSIFKQRGADNVIWVWTVNIEAGGAVSPSAYYPGDAYVDWIGVDGYYHPGLPTTFAQLFGPTLDDLRAHEAKPMLVVETGALAGPLRPSEIQSTFDAVLGTSDVVGFIWFDYNLTSTEGVDWFLDNDRSSLAVYQHDATAAQFALTAPVTAVATPILPRRAS
jgi:hypothetical protein